MQNNKLESKFQKEVKDSIKDRLPKCIIKKNEGTQGFPDLLILNDDRWAVLEVKRSKDAHHQPNQEHYISELSKMSFASFIYPENKEEVLDAMVAALKSSR